MHQIYILNLEVGLAIMIYMAMSHFESMCESYTHSGGFTSIGGGALLDFGSDFC